MNIDPEKMLRGKSKIVIEKTANFAGFAPALDTNLYHTTGTVSYDGLNMTLTNDVADGERFACCIESFHFDFAKLAIAEFSLENLRCDANHALTLKLVTESGNNAITVYGANDGSVSGTQTMLRTRTNSTDGSEIILLPKHNIAAATGKYYCVTLRVNKNDNRVSLLINGQLLGYYTHDVISMSKLGVSYFSATFSAAMSGALNASIAQIRTKLYY